MEWQKYNKAWVAVLIPVVITLVLNILNSFGIKADPSVDQAVTTLVTAFGVYLTPNRGA